MASPYTTLAVDWHLLHRSRLAAADFLAGCAGDPPGRVADVAAGSAEYAALLAQRGWEAYAIDVNLAMCEVARRRHPEVQVVHGDMLEVFDLVRGPLNQAYCIGGALCELGSDEQVRDVVSQMLDLVRPAGSVVIEVPNFDHLRAQARKLSGEINQIPADVRYGDLEDREHNAGSPQLGSLSEGELRLYLPPVSAYREDGTELRLEQTYVWTLASEQPALHLQFDAPGERHAWELALLELTRERLAATLPTGADVTWHGDWDGRAWSEDAPHSIACLRPLQ